ncbi:MAG: DUF3849 domain-containing protein [Oscillospiraceae bacterium]|nr:DUF3849 domain-containing protein [Oscillospiraceae bacterium]
MTNEQLNTKLYEKMFEEQEKYRGWLLGQPPEEILNHTYEYTIREDILMSLEYHDLTDAQASALLKSPDAMSDIFKEFENRETEHMDTVWDCLTKRADAVLKAQKDLPLYLHSASYAREHNELEPYRASYQANVACKKAIEQAVNSNYANYCLDSKTAYEQVAEQFSPERIQYVLAVTAREKDSDLRISRENKAWAQTVPVTPNLDDRGLDHNCYFTVDQCNPGLTDLFINRARREENERKPSLLTQLKAPLPKKAEKGAAKSKEMEL